MRRTCLVSAFTSLLCAGALAQQLVPAEHGAHSCWQRIYGEAHLSAHPNQKVTEVIFSVGYFDESRGAEEDAGYTLFGMSVAMRDGRHGTTGGGCWVDEQGIMTCGVDCDGGGVEVRSRDNGSLLLDLEATGSIRLMECGGDEEEDFFTLEPGLDDKQFLVHPASAKVCKGLLPDWD